MGFDGSTITTTAVGLQITSADTIIINNSRKITGVGAPTDNTDVANKLYVDQSIQGAAIAFSMDITGLNDTQIALVINDLVPASGVANGTQNESVLQDIGFTNATGSVSLTITRSLKQFVTSSGSWVFDQNLTSSV